MALLSRSRPRDAGPSSGFGGFRRSRGFHSSRTWGESTYEVQRWDRARRAGRRWAIAGAVLGTLAGVVLFAPAVWLAGVVTQVSAGRLLLADAQGTVWSGSAVVVLTGGEGSRDARSLPGRLEWTLRPGLAGAGLALRTQLRHDCCLNGTLGLQTRLGWGRVTVSVQSPPGWTAQWPVAWLAGLGTPFNTMQLGGAMRLTTQDLVVERVQGRLRLEGQADLELRDMSSRLATLPRLGTYRLSLRNNPASAGTSAISLETLDGALRLTGTGTWGAGGLRLRGEAIADENDQQALNNLLNLIGRRDGVRSVISIG
jgi:general secretion pathway protein N